MGSQNKQVEPLVVDMAEAAAALGTSVTALRQRMNKDADYLSGWVRDGKRKVWRRADFPRIVDKTLFGGARG